MRYLILLMITMEYWYNRIILKSKKPMPKGERYYPPKDDWSYFDNGEHK